MRFGVVASLLLHASAFGLAFLSLPESWRPHVEPEPVIPISLIREAELALKTSVPAAQPKPPEAKPEPKPEPPAPKEVEAPAPKPEPVLSEPKPAPAPVKPEVKPEVKPQPPKETPKPKPKDEELDLDQLSALVDKAREKEETPGAPAETMLEAERAQAQIGAGDRLTASDKAKMQAAIYRCWNISAIAGMPDANKLIVTVEFELNRDGRLAGQPRVANGLQISLSGNQFWKAAEQSAVRAVISCQPYDFLPQDRYQDWREWTLDFDPSQAAGY